MTTVDARDLTNELEGFDPDKADHPRKVELAQTALRFAVGLLAGVADDTNDDHARAYIVDHLRIMAGADHDFMSRDFNLDDWIEQLENPQDEDGDDDGE
jgi:hypothetical protein